MIKKSLSFLIAFFIVLLIQGQGIIGEWSDHLSFSKAFKVENAGDKIYCATKGGIFYYNTSDNSINKISRLNGLSDFGIKNIAYHQGMELLLVAYNNSNIDLIFENRVINLSDIKRKSITGDKSINDILFIENEAYISCGFGIVVVNLEKREIKDTYLIGENGSQINVFDLEFKDNNLYAATENGLYYADINNPNLLDYRNWSHIDNIPHSGEKFQTLQMFSGNLIAHYSTGNWNQNELYIKTDNIWERYLPGIQGVLDLFANGNKLTITCRSAVYIIDSSHQEYARVVNYPGIEEIQSEILPQSAIYTDNIGLWIADNRHGLIRAGSDIFETIFPEGPIDNMAFYLYSNDNDFWVASGGRSDSWNNTWKDPQFQLFRDGKWNHFTKKEIPEMDGFWDVVCMISHPSDKDHLFVGTWGGGLLEIKNGKMINRYTQYNSSLQTALPGQPTEPFVRIGGLDFDSNGNLWISNSEVADVLSVLKSNGDWESFNLPLVANKRSIGQVTVTQNDDKWLVIPRGHNLYVVNNDGSQKKYLPVKSYFNNGETELITDMNDIYSIAEDNDGAIWVGTSKGVAVYFNPTRIWEPGILYATHPGLNLGDGLYHPLLETETITAIAVDGANRKWMGTVNSGVFLISETGEKEIFHFTEENSPLLSNTISNISINQKTGEVFIGTEKGIISYRGDATGGHDDFSNILVYPNPVRETYSGQVVISGLVQDTDLKITDISGNLVFKTTSLGGQVSWDGNNINGKRVNTGVYLIFLSDKFGEKTHISKLLFIN